MDRLTPAERSANMQRIRRADTKPEWVVRRLLHRLGYRFRLQWRAAPGRPDVAFPGRRKAIFVHGCFWHQHPGCRNARIPRTRRVYWEAKFEANRARDARDLARAAAEGWDTLVVWECETRVVGDLEARLLAFLGAPQMVRVGPAAADGPRPDVSAMRLGRNTEAQQARGDTPGRAKLRLG